MFLSHLNHNLSINSLRDHPFTQQLANVTLFAPLEDDYFEETMILANFNEEMNVEEAYIFS